MGSTEGAKVGQDLLVGELAFLCHTVLFLESRSDVFDLSSLVVELVLEVVGVSVRFGECGCLCLSWWCGWGRCCGLLMSLRW